MTEKKDYAVNLDELVFRRAKETDNFREIAKLIYQTDPYIYPFWFGNDVRACEKFLSERIGLGGFIFNYNNIYVAYDKKEDKILGLIVALDKGIDFDYDYSESEKINHRHDLTIKKYIKGVIKEVKESDAIYIMNCTVLDGYRGKKIGTRLLGYFISQMEEEGYETYALDCLLHNLRAKNLYHTMGFKEMKEIVGFNGVDDTVEVVSFLRHKGNYMPDEFQKREKYVGVK